MIAQRSVAKGVLSRATAEYAHVRLLAPRTSSGAGTSAGRKAQDTHESQS